MKAPFSGILSSAELEALLGWALYFHGRTHMPVRPFTQRGGGNLVTLPSSQTVYWPSPQATSTGMLLSLAYQTTRANPMGLATWLFLFYY